MAVLADGSRICDRNRNPLVGVDVSFVMPYSMLGKPFIYAAGLALTVLSQINNSSTYRWQWRRAGGSFANLELASVGHPISLSSGTVLSQATEVTNANKKTTQSPTSTQYLQECVSNSLLTGPNSTLGGAGDVSSETQCALQTNGAPPGEYEIQVVYSHSAGVASIVYPARIIVPERRKWYTMPPFKRN